MHESSQRNSGTSRVPLQTAPIDRSAAGAAAFGASPGVEASTIMAEPWRPLDLLGGNGSGCYGPFQWGSITIPGNCPMIM